MKKIYLVIVILISCFLGIIIRNNRIQQSAEDILQTNDVSLESDIDVKILYTKVSEDGKEQKELSSTADAYMYFHKTADYNIAIDAYNTGYLNIATKGYKYTSLHEYVVNLFEKDDRVYSNLQWDKLKEDEVTDILKSFEKFEDDYLEGKIALE